MNIGYISNTRTCECNTAPVWVGGCSQMTSECTKMDYGYKTQTRFHILDAICSIGNALLLRYACIELRSVCILVQQLDVVNLNELFPEIVREPLPLIGFNNNNNMRCLFAR